MAPQNGFQFAIDRGGTFTDVYARCPNGKVRVMKLLSVDPQNYDDAPREAIRRILQEETGKALNADGKVDASLIESIRMGTTVATNALLERKGARMALIINKGFKDLLYIGNQARPHIFQLDIKRPGVLYTEVIEVDCRVIPALEDRCQMDKSGKNWKEVVGTTGEKMLVVKDLEEEEVKKDLLALKQKGIESVAVVLAHSYTYHDHEIRIGKIADEIGFKQVSLSHAITSMVRIVPRGFTASADAYLTPHIREYVRGFADGFSGGLKDANVLFMQSDGGLTPMNMFNGSRAILSGPAGGVVGYAMTAYQKETGLPVIGFDMGGTSTDVSRYAGSLEHVHEATTAGVTIQAPQLDINTVAAGGGSMLMFRSGLFVAGPESAGAEPGPACYRKGGPLTVTDANLLLGRLLPEYFPKIFVQEEQAPAAAVYNPNHFKQLDDQLDLLAAVAKDKLKKQIHTEPYLHLRYQSEFGFKLNERDIIVDDVRVRAVGMSAVPKEIPPPSGKGSTPVPEKGLKEIHILTDFKPFCFNEMLQSTKVYFEGGYQDTLIYLLEKLKPEQVVPGPAIIMDGLLSCRNYGAGRYPHSYRFGGAEAYHYGAGLHTA
ncbi:hypothetical protein HF086_013790 [Spodoptera exigua]|uniref:5-oxoprolinase n=1 Tax=Spodoptera exigua TaxID=7107 RepID=A0A922SCP5_SPOEX|nr:hypothetical protein HF086_013790 [Spodoptera exigua]